MRGGPPIPNEKVTEFRQVPRFRCSSMTNRLAAQHHGGPPPVVITGAPAIAGAAAIVDRS